MKFYSTNNKNSFVTLREAVLKGLAEDGGLFMPAQIPALPEEFFDRSASLSFQDISFEAAKALLSEDLPINTLRKIIDDAFNFNVPLIRIDEQISVLELFHGPTLAFKDFAARFMAQLLSYFTRNFDRELNILVATSGDTGSAVARGFMQVPGIKVFILYPSGKISAVQEKQLTTIGDNITALEIKGSFDDCQKLVKQAFVDKDLIHRIPITSANSINIARLIPQSFYYFYAYSKVKKTNRPIVFSIPSGNFGNLTGGLIAGRMGLPVSRFIAATNKNDSVPRYLQTAVFDPQPMKKTISNAMDVGNPSNFARILDLYDHSVETIRKDIWGASFSDEQTKAAIKEVYNRYNYIMDPHGAVGYLGLTAYRGENKRDIDGIFLETAHPAKFLDIVQKLIDGKIVMPDRLKACLEKEKQSVLLDNNYNELKQYLVK